MDQQLERALRSRVETFAADITRLLQSAVADAVKGALLTSAPAAKGAAPANGSGRRAPRTGGPYAKMLAVLRANPGMPIPELTKAVYGNARTATMKRTRAALNSMKGKSVSKVRGKRGAWQAL